MNKNFSEGVKDVEAVGKDSKVFAKLTFDKGFKIVLGTEGRSEKILRPLLNRLLDFRIVDLQFLQTEKVGLTEEDGESVFDVYCKDVGKKWDYNFESVYVIAFLNQKNNISEDPEDPRVNPYISRYITRSIATGKDLQDGTNRVFIDLHRFRKTFEECSDDVERWLFSIKNMHMLKEFPTGVDGTELEDLYCEAKLAAWNPDLRTKYERLMGNELDRELGILYEY